MAALKFKEQGNECVRKGSKHYPDALGYYSLAILYSKDDHLDKKTISDLYSNRAQVHLYLKSYRRALWDAETAILLCSTDYKAHIMAVKAALELGMLDESKVLCDNGLKACKDDGDLEVLAQETDERTVQRGKDQGSEAEPTSEVPWSQLPTDILILIAGKFHFAEDLTNFGMVCKPWHVAFIKTNNPCPLLPFVLLPEEEEMDLRRFYCPINERVYKIHLPETRGARCWGSSCNWLATIDSKSQLHLLDPFSRARILLPSLLECPGFGNNDFIYQFILSSDPLSGNCMVFAASPFGKLNFTKPGDEGWGVLHYESDGIVEDAMLFRKKIYVILNDGDVVIGDASGNYLKTLSIPALVEAFNNSERVVSYILEICGKIFVIARHMLYPEGSRHGRTLSFKVHQLDEDTGECNEVNSLGDWSVFVGNNRSFAICESDYPECTKNCIYFTDDKYVNMDQFDVPGSYDTGVHCLDDHTTRPLLQMEFSEVMYYFVPVWIKPSLW